MDMENFGEMGLPINPADFQQEIGESVENYLRSHERRNTEVQWAIDDLSAAPEGDAMAGIDFLMTVAKAEQAHSGRDRKFAGKLAAKMALKALEDGTFEKMGLPELPEGLVDHLHQMAGEQPRLDASEDAPEVTGDAVIEGIGSFDDLPVVEEIEDPPADKGGEA